MKIDRIIEELPRCFETMCAEARAERHDFLDRLAADWNCGAMRFDAPGEGLFAAVVGGELAGIGGLSVDLFVPEALRMRRSPSGVPAQRCRAAARANAACGRSLLGAAGHSERRRRQPALLGSPRLPTRYPRRPYACDGAIWAWPRLISATLPSDDGSSGFRRVSTEELPRHTGESRYPPVRRRCGGTVGPGFRRDDSKLGRRRCSWRPPRSHIQKYARLTKDGFRLAQPILQFCVIPAKAGIHRSGDDANGGWFSARH